MSKAEKFIEEHTMNCSNQYDFPEYFENGIKRPKEYQPWLTTDQARKAVEIAREETINEVCKWLNSHLIDYWSQSVTDESRFIEELKKYLERKK